MRTRPCRRVHEVFPREWRVLSKTRIFECLFREKKPWTLWPVDVVCVGILCFCGFRGRIVCVAMTASSLPMAWADKETLREYENGRETTGLSCVDFTACVEGKTAMMVFMCRMSGLASARSGLCGAWDDYAAMHDGHCMACRVRVNCRVWAFHLKRFVRALTMIRAAWADCAMFNHSAKRRRVHVSSVHDRFTDAGTA